MSDLGKCYSGYRGLVLSALVLAALATAGVNAGAQNTTVVIDTAKTGAPISPYIYGQFIEHLGRCIYGGLWSEMLEDRKFYYPVDGKAPAWEMFTPGGRSHQGEGHSYELLMRSPWMIIGPNGAVSMVTRNSYVGKQTPRVTLPGNGKPAGIEQERLGLTNGRTYVGRIVLAGDASAGPVKVSLVWGGGAYDRDTITIANLTGKYRKFPLRFTAGGSTDNGRLEIVGAGSGNFLVGTVSLMPANNIYGWRADTVARLKELNAPVYRWPGGNFVSGYNWRDGIGDPDRRPPRKNPAWKGIEPNDVGVDEYLDLMREIGAEAYISVNTGLGGAKAAAAEVEYLNGAPDTPMGRLRARNGHPRPYGVKWFAVGNEMYGQWQLGHMPLEKYVEKHNRVVDAMRAVDPTIQVVAVGRVGKWSREMLAHCADHMSLISEHLYWQNKKDLVAHVAQVPERIRQVAAAHRAYRRELASLRGRNIRVAMDEWNYWYGPNEYGELGVRYYLQDALGIAAGLHEFFRDSDVYFMANYAQTVNVLGAIKTSKTQTEFATTGLVLKLYRARFGKIPVAVSGKFQPLDIAAAWSGDRTEITVGIVNPTREKRTLALRLEGCRLVGRGRRWLLTGASRWAYNAPGAPRQVDIVQTSFTSGAETLEAPPLSVSLYALPVR